MTPDPRFTSLQPKFWAHVRSISQETGYTERKKKRVKTPGIEEIKSALDGLGLSSRHVATSSNRPSKFGQLLADYFSYRARVLNDGVEPLLMSKESASRLYEKLLKKRKYRRPLPMNKQKRKKKKPAYFTAIINMLMERRLDGLPCDYNPRKLTTITKGGVPVRTLARWLDGAFPSPVNPIAIWEIKEYYHTKTFGSRVADGVYETLLDGMEVEELRMREKVDVKHYLMIDDHFTWWECGRSYLCRIIDMLHMGYVDEVLFGKEVVDRIPVLVDEWITIDKSRRA